MALIARLSSRFNAYYDERPSMSPTQIITHINDIPIC